MATKTFIPGQAAAPSTFVEISVSCRNLFDSDVFSKSDPICVLFIKEPWSTNFREFGRTEMIKDNLNPDFVHKFVLEYHFEEIQNLKFEIYDIDSSSPNLKDHDFIGRMECTLGEVVAYEGREFRRNLVGNSGIDKGKYGYILLVTEEIKDCKNIVRMQFSGKRLDKKDFFGKSDPFLVFSRQNDDNSFSVVHKTEVIKHNLDPTWSPFTISVQVLCNGAYDRPLKIQCYDWNRDGSQDLIGEFMTDLQTLSEGPGLSNDYECINPKKKAKKKSYKNSGVIKLLSMKIQEQPSFLDFIKGGTQLHCTVAIDFTASNGDPRDPKSLHYMKSHTTPNPYALAISAVGEIIQDYNSDKLFPALGFGARLPPDGRVSHEFPLNGNSSNIFCHGVEGILEAYHKCLHSVQLYGPTNFAPVINHVAKFAKANTTGSHYFILVIITDGIITDMPNTKEAIVQAALCPMSIIIIGVGNADFSAMEVLDGDVVRISSKGRYAERDIVQFVPFRDFLSGVNWVKDKAALAKEVLFEIPTQFLDYMKLHGIKPREGSPEPLNVYSQDRYGANYASLERETEWQASAPPAPSLPQWYSPHKTGPSSLWQQ